MVENEKKLFEPDLMAVFEASIDIVFCNDYATFRKMRMTLQTVMKKRISQEKRMLSGKKQ